MLDKKRQEKIKAPIELEKTVTEILVANGRTIEPFIKVFHSSGENIAKSALGSLVGVFEIAEQSEDSAYIVNFLTSVAKKEYFSNPRRGSIESFEAALHKINLALAELVKHGNILWLGKFHGALGVLEKNNFHFSVTGKAQILLLRSDGFSEISAGLASPESITHPIKTFVEISSGRLMLDDKIILASPELLYILPLEDLKKNALRMDNERFSQFLRTVLVNELDMAGAVVLDIEEGAPVIIPQKETKSVPDKVLNAFSEQSYIPSPRPANADDQTKIDKKENPPKEEYVDSKTGHIYVQGATSEKNEENPILERAKLFLQDSAHGAGTFFGSQARLLRKGRKQAWLSLLSLSGQSAVVTRKTLRLLRATLQDSTTRVATVAKESVSKMQKSDRGVISPPAQSPPRYTRPVPTQDPVPKKRVDVYSPAPTENAEEIPLFMKEKLAAFYQKNKTSPLAQKEERTTTPDEPLTTAPSVRPSLAEKPLRSAIAWRLYWDRTTRTLLRILKQLRRFITTLVARLEKRTLSFGLLFIILLIGGSLLAIRAFQKNNAVRSTETTTPTLPESSPLSTENNVRMLSGALEITSSPEPTVTSVLLAGETFLITETTVQSIGDNKHYSLPSGNGKIRFATPMDDLRLIFVYTDTDAIFAWSPISHTYVKNNLTLPAGTVVKDMGTYLTYLYVLDKTNNQIYRFPRADGGFGAGSSWLRDSLNFEDNTRMAINETIFLAPSGNTVSAYFRGRLVKNLESPAVPLVLTSLFAHPGVENIYALDTENKRILVWNQDGALIAQYYSEALADGHTITISEKTNEAFVTTANALLSFKLSVE
jgi:hypothetical protein